MGAVKRVMGKVRENVTEGSRGRAIPRALVWWKGPSTHRRMTSVSSPQPIGCTWPRMSPIGPGTNLQLYLRHPDFLTMTLGNKTMAFLRMNFEADDVSKGWTCQCAGSCITRGET